MPTVLAPSITSISSDDGPNDDIVGDGITNADQLSIDAAATPNSTVDVFDGATFEGTAAVDGLGVWSLPTGILSDGLYTFAAADTVAGVSDQASPSVNVTVDTIAPASPVITSWSPDSVDNVDYGVTNSNHISLNGTAEANCSITVFDNGIQIGTSVTNSAGAWTFTAAAVPDGINAFTASATDAAGNTSSQTYFATHVIVDTAAPVTAPLVGGAQIGVMMEGAESSWIGFPGAKDLDYLKSNGVDLVRLDISWEMMQNALNGPLNQTYLSGLETFLSQAATRGMKVIIVPLNDGEYDVNWQQDKAAHGGLFSSAWNLGQPIGSSAVPVSAFANFWTQLSTALAGNAAVAGYDLMNEPANISPSTWQTAAQSAIDAIRAVDTKTPIYVEGAEWAAASTWTLPWYSGNLGITDPDNNIIYEAHQYFDANSSGLYQQAFNANDDYANMGADLLSPWVNWLKANSYKGLLGEFGVPVNDPQWLPMLNATLNYLQANGIAATYCNYTYNQWCDISICPDNNQGAAVMAAIFEHTAPSITGFVPDNGSGSGAATTANELTLSGTGASYDTVEIFDGGVLLGTTTSGISGGWSFTTGALANGAHAFSATNIDAGGDTSETSFALKVTVEVPHPAVTTILDSPSSVDLGVGTSVTLTVDFSEAVTVSNGTPTLTLNDGGVATYSGTTNTGALTFSYTVGAGQNTASLAVSAINLNGATIADGAGNAADLSLTSATQTGPPIDTATPAVTSIVDSPTGSALDAGKTVTLTVDFSEAVTVSNGTPTLTLNDGGVATYSGTTNTDALIFSYTVVDGQNTASLAVSAINLNGATIADGAGNAANLSLTSAAQTGPQIDTATPAVTSIVDSPSSSALDAGKTVTLTVDFSEAVTVSNGTPTLTLNDGGVATYSGTTNTGALIFSYTVVDGQNTASLAVSAINLNGATIADGAGNAADLSLTSAAQTGPQIDTATPTVRVNERVGLGGGRTHEDPMAGGNGSWPRVTTVTLSGTVASKIGIRFVDIFNGSVDLGAAALNGNGTWNFVAPFGAGSYNRLYAVATDMAGNKATAKAPYGLRFGITGRPYTTAETFYDKSGGVNREIFARADGSDYAISRFGFTEEPYATTNSYYNNKNVRTTEVFKRANGSDYAISRFGLTGEPYVTTHSYYNNTGARAIEVFKRANGSDYAISRFGLTGEPYVTTHSYYNNKGARVVEVFKRANGYDYEIAHFDISGRPFMSWRDYYNAIGKLVESIANNKSGSHRITAHVRGQTLVSTGDGKDIFVFDVGFGHDAVLGLSSHLSGANHDTISVSKSDFTDFSTMLADTKYVGDNAVITATNGDQLTLDDMTKALLPTICRDFAFRAAHY